MKKLAITFAMIGVSLLFSSCTAMIMHAASKSNSISSEVIEEDLPYFYPVNDK